MNVSRFEKEAGLANGYFRQVKKNPSPEKIDKIRLAFPDLNTDWLVTGVGSMYVEGKEEGKPGQAPANATPGAYAVPLLPVAAQGGALSDFAASVMQWDCERITAPVKADFALTVTGASMEPEYPSGSIIFVKKINEKAFIEWGKTYVLDTCNGVVIKELRESEDKSECVCHSINPDPKYQPFRVKWSDVFGVYRVVLLMAMK